MTSQEFESFKRKLNSILKEYPDTEFYRTILLLVENNSKYLKIYQIDDFQQWADNAKETINITFKFDNIARETQIQFTITNTINPTISTHILIKDPFSNEEHRIDKDKLIAEEQLSKYIKEGVVSTKETKLLKSQIKNIINNFNLSEKDENALRDLLKTINSRECYDLITNWNIGYHLRYKHCSIYVEFSYLDRTKIDIDIM